MYEERLESWKASRAGKDHAYWTCGMGRMTALHIYVRDRMRNSGAVEQGREGGVYIILSLK
jgi:hypothetical protein